MTQKNKIISLIVVGVILFPAIIGSFMNTNEASVLGAIDDTRQNSGQVAGGVIDYKDVSDSVFQDRVLDGLALLDRQAGVPVSTDRFPLASEIIVETDFTQEDLIVSKVQSIPDENVLIILDEPTFRLLGGNPESGETIPVSVLQG